LYNQMLRQAVMGTGMAMPQKTPGILD